MRTHQLRFDVWVCLALAFLGSFVPVKLAERIMAKTYADYDAAHTVADGDIGGKAGADVFRAQSVEDLLSHDTFTVVSPGIQYANRGAGYHGSYYMHALTLPSGELVAMVYNSEGLQTTGEDIYSGDTILPVGRVVYEDLSQDESFLSQIEHSEKLSRTDFYVDMLGTGGKMTEEDYQEVPRLMVQLLSVVIFFPLLHMAGSKVGIFPYFFPPKQKKAPAPRRGPDRDTPDD